MVPSDGSDGSDDTLGAAWPPRSRTAPTAVTPQATTVDGPIMLPESGRERYQLGPLLGKGGMGEVLLATDAQVGRDVAVKTMRIQRSPDAIARFLREARIQGRLEHPAIVPVHEIWIDESGRPRFAMKHLTGTTLADVLAAHARGDVDLLARYPRQRLLSAFADVCLAIEFAHTRGVVHRDLKPANIMLGEFGEVHVLDWGVARVLTEPSADGGTTESSSGTQVGAAIGTPGYMSPVQVRGDATLDARADVYALGCVLFEVLAGVPLGNGETRPSVRASGREIPPELDAVWVSATAADRDLRTTTARAVAEGVRRYLDGDRDLALRKQLASDHLAVAREALARGDRVADRRIAIQEAGRALALDPTAAEAAALLTRLMLEPPREIPDEVERELIANEVAAISTHRRHSLFQKLMLLTAIPLLMWIGVRSVWIYVVIAAVAAFEIIRLVAVNRRGRPVTSIDAALAIAGNALIVGTTAWIFTPFLMAPAMAVTIAFGLAHEPRYGTAPWLCGSVAVALLAPWLLEVAGVVPPTMQSLGSDLLITSPAVHLQMPQLGFVFALTMLMLIVMGVIQVRQLVMAQRVARRTLSLQAWHLRQLVPAE